MKKINYRGRNIDSLNRSRRFRKSVSKSIASEEVIVVESVIVEEEDKNEEVLETTAFEENVGVEEIVTPKKKGSKPKTKKSTENKETASNY